MKHNRKLTPEELRIIEQMSAIRLPMDQMATLLGMSYDTFHRMTKSDSALRASIQSGRSRGWQQVRQTLFQMAVGHEARYDRNGNKIRSEKHPRLNALKFWCQTQEGFKITEKVEHSGPDGSPIEIEDRTKAIFEQPELADAARKLALAFVTKKPEDEA